MDEGQQAFQDFERDGWDEVASTYEKIAGGATAAAAGVLLDAVDAGPGKTVIDVACGPGHGLVAALDRGATVIGVDISERMVALASARAPAADVRQGAGETLPVDDGSADAVVSAFGLPHFADHAAVFAEAARVLRPGGRLAMATWLPPDRNPFFGVAMGAIARAGDLSLGASLPAGEDMFAYADIGRAQADFAAAGFDQVHLVEHNASFDSPDAPALMGPFYTGGSVRTRALFGAHSEEQRSAILATAGQILQEYRTDDGYSIPLRYVVITAN